MIWRFTITTCKWCGKKFTKETNRQVYCSDVCSLEGEKENAMFRMRKFRRNNPFKYNNHLGSRGLSLGKSMRDNFDEELFVVEKEMKKLGLKLY